MKLAVAEMYVQGVSTRKVADVTLELCGLEVSSMQVSRAATLLDEELEAWRNRPLDRTPYLILDARYEKVRHGGSVVDCAVLVAIGILPSGKRTILGVSVSLSEAEVHWRTFLKSLIDRGLLLATLQAPSPPSPHAPPAAKRLVQSSFLRRLRDAKSLIYLPSRTVLLGSVTSEKHSSIATDFLAGITLPSMQPATRRDARPQHTQVALAKLCHIAQNRAIALQCVRGEGRRAPSRCASLVDNGIVCARWPFSEIRDPSGSRAASIRQE